MHPDFELVRGFHQICDCVDCNPLGRNHASRSTLLPRAYCPHSAHLKEPRVPPRRGSIHFKTLMRFRDTDLKGSARAFTSSRDGVRSWLRRQRRASEQQNSYAARSAGMGIGGIEIHPKDAATAPTTPSIIVMKVNRRTRSIVDSAVRVVKSSNEPFTNSRVWSTASTARSKRLSSER